MLSMNVLNQEEIFLWKIRPDHLEKQIIGTVVVAQLVERLLLTPEVRGSNPVIGKLFYRRLFVYCQLNRKDEDKEKKAGEWPI